GAGSGNHAQARFWPADTVGERSRFAGFAGQSFTETTLRKNIPGKRSRLSEDHGTRRCAEVLRVRPFEVDIALSAGDVSIRSSRRSACRTEESVIAGATTSSTVTRRLQITESELRVFLHNRILAGG